MLIHVCFFVALQSSGLKHSALLTSDQIWQWRDPYPNQSHGGPIEAQRLLPDGPVEFQRVNNKKSFPVEKIGTRDLYPNQSHRTSIMDQHQLPDGSVEFQRVNNNKSFPVEKIVTRDPYPNQSHRTPIEDQRQLLDGPVEFQRANNKKPFPMEKIRKFEGNLKIEPMGPFPDLIIMNLHKGKVYTGLQLLQKCFAESPYGPLRVETIDQGFYV